MSHRAECGANGINLHTSLLPAMGEDGGVQSDSYFGFFL